MPSTAAPRNITLPGMTAPVHAMPRGPCRDQFRLPRHPGRRGRSRNPAALRALPPARSPACRHLRPRRRFLVRAARRAARRRLHLHRRALPPVAHPGRSRGLYRARGRQAVPRQAGFHPAHPARRRHGYRRRRGRRWQPVARLPVHHFGHPRLQVRGRLLASRRRKPPAICRAALSPAKSGEYPAKPGEGGAAKSGE